MAGMNDLSLSIRSAAPADLDEVLAFWKTAAEGTSISDDGDGVARLVERDPEALILAERDGTLVGTVIAGFDGWRCHLYRLAVHPDQRRRGVGSASSRRRRNGSPRWAGGAPTPWSSIATPPPTTRGARRGTRPSRSGAAG
ncbi:Acetyltransferase (GNAT) domain-containing protein [Streptomyces sp. Ncost-T6T-2b]|nr:Acetyltransferase (GNAT) domain-containing protein [Streptomyces sp. Ncost-T6T-2b]